MTSPIRILDTGLRPARWNVAMTAALAARHADGATPDTVRFHRYPRVRAAGAQPGLRPTPSISSIAGVAASRSRTA